MKCYKGFGKRQNERIGFLSSLILLAIMLSCTFCKPEGNEQNLKEFLKGGWVYYEDGTYCEVFFDTVAVTILDNRACKVFVFDLEINGDTIKYGFMKGVIQVLNDYTISMQIDTSTLIHQRMVTSNIGLTYDEIEQGFPLRQNSFLAFKGIITYEEAYDLLEGQNFRWQKVLEERTKLELERDSLRQIIR